MLSIYGLDSVHQQTGEFIRDAHSDQQRLTTERANHLLHQWMCAAEEDHVIWIFPRGSEASVCAAGTLKMDTQFSGVLQKPSGF